MNPRSLLRLGALATYFAPILIPRGRGEGIDEGIPDIPDAVQRCRESGLQGRELIDFATRLVREQFLVYSIRTPWKPARWAWRDRVGHAQQYNRALSQILTQLGVANELVFCARVRTTNETPWWWMNHVWVRVIVDDRERDVCARHGRTVGDVAFQPLERIQPFQTRTRITTTTAACIGSAWEQWSTLIGGGTPPSWLEDVFARPLD